MFSSGVFLILKLSYTANYRQPTESFTDFGMELKREFKLAKDSMTKSCDEHKNCAQCQQKYWEVDWRLYIYIGVKRSKSKRTD